MSRSDYERDPIAYRAGVAEGIRHTRVALDRADARFAAHEDGFVILADFYLEVKATLETT